jgi:hypothetical protein
MEVKPEVVVLSASGVEHSGLEKVLRTGQDDASYVFRFIPATDTSFPQDLVQQVNAKNLVIFLWDPAKLYTIEWFKKMLAEVKNKKNNILFCHTGDAQILPRDKDLLDKWKKNFDLTERCFTVEQGIDAEAVQKRLIAKVIEVLGLKSKKEVFEFVPLSDAPKIDFLYAHKKVGRNHSRQKRADFIEAHYVPCVGGRDSLEALMQFFAVYMSIPETSSDLSQAVEKVLVASLMSPQGNAEYLANAKLDRLAKEKDRYSIALKELLARKFSEAHPAVEFTRVINVLIQLQNYISDQETAWGFKIFGGAEHVKIVEATIEKIMLLTKEIYPCLFKSEITAADRTYLKLESEFPVEIMDIVDKAFPKAEKGLFK